MNIRFDHPELLWLLLLAVPIVWLGLHSLATLDRVRRWTAIAVRLAVLTVVVLMLAGLQAVQRHTDLTVIAVIDQSESVRRFAKPPPKLDETGRNINEGVAVEQWLKDYLREAGEQRRAEDRLGVVRYDQRASVVLPDQAIELDPGTIAQPMEGTNTADAIRSAMAIVPANTASRMVLVTDGNDTAGDPRPAAREAAAAGVTFDVLPMLYRLDNEVMVEAVYAPTEAREGQTIPIRVVLRATRPTTGVLQLLHDETPIDLDPASESTGAPIRESDWTLESAATADDEASDDAQIGRYVAVRQIDVPIRYTGTNLFEAVFEPDSGADTMVANNRAGSFTLVAGKGVVLYVDGVGGASGAILAQALANHDIRVDQIAPHQFPSRLSELQRYDAVLFQNVPAEMITGPQQENLVKYVHDLGGGFAMIGGPDSFGAGAWTNTPVDQYLLPVTCEIPSQTILPSGALVLVIDRSGSMSSSVMGSNKSQMELASEAAVLALQTLYPQDLVGVVAFDHSAKLIVDVDYNSDPAGVAKRVRSLQAGGGTNIYSGLEMAYNELAPLQMQDAAIKHIVLLTDGQSQDGNYIQLVGKMAAAGITISTVGVGDGHDAQLLQQLARMGRGQYHSVQNPNNLPQVFIKEAKTIRKNLIKEATFTPTLQQTGSPVTANLSGTPPLRGLVLTGERSDPRVFMAMLGPEGEPLFAHWQVGLGRAAAFTSDATNRWADPWLGWGGYGDFWARLVRQIARPSQSREVDLTTTIDGGRLRVRLDAAGLDTGGSFMRVQGSVTRPDGSTQQITLDQTGPGLYETAVDAAATGNYMVSLILDDGTGERRVTAFGGASRPPGEELRRFSSNLAMLQEIASITGGRILDPRDPAAANLFDRTQVVESRSIRPLWRTLLVVLLVLFLLDVANRRVAWDAPAIWAWTKERAASLRHAAKPRSVEEHSTLQALRKARHKQPDAKEESTQPAAPAPDRKRKFEAAPEARPSEDFATAVGGARQRDREAVVLARNARGEDGEEQGGLARLRAAKRAARDRMDRNE